jgi:isopenicillin-N epimerase
MLEPAWEVYPLPTKPAAPDEQFWTSVRRQFLIPPDLTVMNAANLTPASVPVMDALYRTMLDIERDPSPFNRMKIGERIEACRQRIADFLHVQPADIVITRNASEANNLIANGLDLKPGDEVLIYSDNHPSNNAAWCDKAKRFGFTIDVVNQINPHPGGACYVDAFLERMNPRTRVLALTHVTGQVGDVLPVRELSIAARERGVLTLVDGAQSFGVIPIDLSDMRPDFFTASAHKWACGPKEVGILYINPAVQSQVWPNIVSSRPGAIGISRTHEALGQRNDASIVAFAEALTLESRIGPRFIEARARQLAQMLMAGLQDIDGVRLWTHSSADRCAAIVSFRPGDLDPLKLSTVLYRRHGIVCSHRTGTDRPGLRFSPHMYNSPTDVARVLATVRDYVHGNQRVPEMAS